MTIITHNLDQSYAETTPAVARALAARNPRTMQALGEAPGDYRVGGNAATIARAEERRRTDRLCESNHRRRLRTAAAAEERTSLLPAVLATLDGMMPDDRMVRHWRRAYFTYRTGRSEAMQAVRAAVTLPGIHDLYPAAARHPGESDDHYRMRRGGLRRALESRLAPVHAAYSAIIDEAIERALVTLRGSYARIAAAEAQRHVAEHPRPDLDGWQDGLARPWSVIGLPAVARRMLENAGEKFVAAALEASLPEAVAAAKREIAAVWPMQTGEK